VSRYRIEPLGSHDRAGFACGSAPLDAYLRERASQDVKRRIASCFVAVAEDGAIAGYYTLAATGLAFGDLPLERARKLPRYPVVPAILLGRLAVAVAHQGKRLGGALVADALERAAASEIMAHAMVVEAKDAASAAFYAHLGFEPLPDTPLRLIRRL
jgi:GNAT superfamily N-acetyltransferase